MEYGRPCRSHCVAVPAERKIVWRRTACVAQNTARSIRAAGRGRLGVKPLRRLRFRDTDTGRRCTLDVRGQSHESLSTAAPRIPGAVAGQMRSGTGQSHWPVWPDSAYAGSRADHGFESDNPRKLGLPLSFVSGGVRPDEIRPQRLEGIWGQSDNSRISSANPPPVSGYSDPEFLTVQISRSVRSRSYINVRAGLPAGSALKVRRECGHAGEPGHSDTMTDSFRSG